MLQEIKVGCPHAAAMTRSSLVSYHSESDVIAVESVSFSPG